MGQADKPKQFHDKRVKRKFSVVDYRDPETHKRFYNSSCSKCYFFRKAPDKLDEHPRQQNGFGVMSNRETLMFLI